MRRLSGCDRRGDRPAWTEQGSLITVIGFPLIIYHSPLPHTYTLSFLHRHPESFRPVTSAPAHFFHPYSQQLGWSQLAVYNYYYMLHTSAKAKAAQRTGTGTWVNAGLARAAAALGLGTVMPTNQASWTLLACWTCDLGATKGGEEGAGLNHKSS